MKNSSIKKIDFLSKHFFFNLRVFDFPLKSNLLITKVEQLPNNFKIVVNLPLIPFYVEGVQWIKLIYNSLWLVSFFSKKQAALSKYWIIQKNKKRVSSAIIFSKNLSNFSFFTIPLLSLVTFPYIKISKGLSKFNLLSDSTGNLTFLIDEISYLSNKLDETYIGWNKSILINLTLWKPKIYNNLYKFSFINFRINRLIWSSIGLKCIWGHGGFLHNSYVRKFYKNWKNKFIYKKYLI